MAREIVGDKSPWTSSRWWASRLSCTVRARYDGDFDRTGLPDEVILTNYFVVRDDRIAALFVTFNTAGHRAVN